MIFMLCMTLWPTIRRLLPTLAVVGLILTPVARPTMIQAAETQSIMSDDMVMTDHAESAMPDMLCCPEQSPSPDCGKDCPQMACSTSCAFQTVTPAFELFLALTLASVVIPADVLGPDSLAQAPPPRPPKI